MIYKICDIKTIENNNDDLKELKIILNGRNMRSKESLMTEISDKLFFPDYFGRNWDALDECLTDFCWINYDKIKIIINDYNLILKEEKDSQKDIFNSCIIYANNYWEKKDFSGYKDNPNLKVDFYLIEN